MSDALPALTWGEVISVIALFGNPPPVASSSGASSVVRRACRGTNDWGKRSASSLRRSMTDELLPDMPHHGMGNSYVQMNTNAVIPNEVRDLTDVRTPPLRYFPRFLPRIAPPGNDLAAFPPRRPHLFADQRHHDSLDAQLAGRNKVGK